MQTALETTPPIVDRRQSRRYRHSAPITVWLPDRSAVPAMSIEISESGLSACLNPPLAVGEKAELEPVGGGRVSAIVRRTTGRVNGFEFLNLTSEQLLQVRTLCARLPMFRGGAMGI
jgi:PilZ domain